MFGKRLRLLREERGLKQQEIADLLEISTSTIGMYERGHRDPNTDSVRTLAKFFNVTTDYLLGYSDKRSGKITDERFTDELKEILIKNGIIDENEEISDEKMEWLMKLIDKAVDMSNL